MKSIDKNLGSKQKRNDDTWLYLILFFLLAVLVGVGVWHYLKPDETQNTPIDYSELGDEKENPEAKDISELFNDNKKREKKIARALANPRKNFSASEREELQRRLNNAQGKFNALIRSTDLEKEIWTPELLKTIYSLLYEQGKTLVELKSKIISDKSYQELKKQWKITQKEWEISPAEKQEIDAQLKKVIHAWYHKFMKEELRPGDGSRRWEYIDPELINYRPASRDVPADVDHFRKIHKAIEKGTGKLIITDLSNHQPVEIKFQGYDGFLTADDETKSEEGKQTFGLTLSEKPTSLSEEDDSGKIKDKFKVIPGNRRTITIKLKKELFFNRERGDYEEWLVKVYQNEKSWGRTYFDISWDDTIETIAHELAHAVINSLKPHYEGERKGGHGKLHDQFQERIETMIKTTNEYQEFQQWWNKKKK